MARDNIFPRFSGAKECRTNCRRASHWDRKFCEVAIWICMHEHFNNAGLVLGIWNCGSVLWKRAHGCQLARHELRRCVRNPFWKVCGMCARAALFWACDVRSHFCTLFGTNLPENATFCLEKMFLEHLFLLWNVLFCFGSSYSVFEHPKP